MVQDDALELHAIWDEARSYIEAGNYDKAIEIYRYVLIRYDDNDVAVEHANAYLGDIFLTLRRLNLAKKHIQKAISYAPRKPAYYYILGFIYSINRQWHMAVAEFEIATKIEPQNAEYLRGLGWAIFNRGDKVKGLALLHNAHVLEPANINILTDLAVANMAVNDFNEAILYAERASRLKPENAMAQDVLRTALVFRERAASLDIKVGKVKRIIRPAIPVPSSTHFVFRFKVSLKNRPNIWRIIDIKGNQMLSSLHKAIFGAFDRFEEHAYSFFMSGNPRDEENEYTSVLPDIPSKVKTVNHVRIDSLDVFKGQKFLYLFDFGDQWWHEIELIEVTQKATQGTYPRVVKKQGKSPPQYSSRRR